MSSILERVMDFFTLAWVKVLRLLRTWNSPEDDDVSLLLKNHLIAHKILTFLPTPRVKGLRTLFSLWNIEGLQILRRRDDLVITPFKASSHFFTDPDLDIQETITAIAISSISDLKFPHWHLNFGVGKWSQDWKSRVEKFSEDLAWFFHNSQGHDIKTLTLSGRTTGLTNVTAVLRGVQASLTKLSLDLECFKQTIPHPPTENLELPRLRSLSLNVSCLESEDFLRPFLQSLLSGADSSIQSLSLVGRTPLEEMAKLLQPELNIFVNLTTLTLDCRCDNGNLTALASLRLKKLHLRGLSAGEIDLRPVLQDSSHLEELLLHIKTEASYVWFILLRIPQRMAKLTTLSVLLSLDEDTFPLTFRLDAGNEDDRLDLNRSFPSLSKLTIWPVFDEEDNFRKKSEGLSWRKFEPTLNAFLGTVVPTPSLRILDIPFLLNGEYHLILDSLEASFPNVVFPPELVFAKGGPVWTLGN